MVIVIMALTFSPADPEWCNESINAGDCQMNSDDEICYCIDATMTKTQDIDLYSFSQSKCDLYNGTLAAPDVDQILLWLSKRMYLMGVDNAIVALLKDEEEGWYWSKGENREFAQVIWRPDVPTDPEDVHAMLTVRTVIVEDDYDYAAYNYDHYIDVDPKYQWYGLTTSDNKPNHRLGSYYICSYKIKPHVILDKEETTTTALSIDRTDSCACAANERIVLSELNEHAIFTSPRYPKNYCSDNHCKWTVTTTERLTIQITWIVFSTEKNMDFVYIYDGDSDDSPLMQACSATDCGDHKSSGSAMQVHFSADHVITDLGFKFKVTVIEPDPCYCSESLHMSLTNPGETFVLNSPRYPEPYCSNLKCGWTISAPEGHAVNIKWDRFEAENDRAYLLVYEQKDDSHVLKNNCTGATCADHHSYGQEVYLEFVSDKHPSEAAGFKAVATVIKNYCVMHVHRVPAGTVTASEPPRSDGYIAAGTKVTVTCPVNYKIRNTVEDLSDSAVCDAPHWSKVLEICVPVCHLDYAVEYSLESINFCTFGKNLQTTMVEQGNEVKINTYDYINGTVLKESKIYVCGENGWSDRSIGVESLQNTRTRGGTNTVLFYQPPVCHPLGILTVGVAADTNSRSVELYTPTAETHSSQILQTELLFQRKGYDIAMTDGGGPILVIGGQHVEFSESGMSSTITGYFELLDINKNSSTTGPEMKQKRMNLATTVLRGVIYACGGCNNTICLVGSRVCQRFQNGQWITAKPMKEGRMNFRLVAIGQWLYAIGGMKSYMYSGSNTVERYSLKTNAWQFKNSMTKGKMWFGTATLNGYIYACGGFNDKTCEKYSPEEDQWQSIANMTTVRAEFSLVAFDGVLYALGGAVPLIPTSTLERYYDNKWTVVAELVLERNTPSILTSFIGNIPAHQEGYQSQLLPHKLDLSALAKLTHAEPEWTNAPIVYVDNSPNAEDACACLTNEGIELRQLEESKTFQSPGYPDHYCDNNKCLWTISVLGSEHLAIRLEWVSFSTENQMDLVSIYEGNDDDIRLLDLCTGSHCSNQFSDKNMMQVYFTSDHVATDIGFKARVIAVDPDPCHCYHSKEISLASHIESYTLLSPNYPNSYCGNVDYDCTWLITGLQDYGLVLMWDFFNLGVGDTLKIYNGIELLEECTAGHCSDLVSPGDQLSIDFASESSTTDQNKQQAFSATISVVRNYCHKITIELGTIEYDREARTDGNLLIGTQAVVSCPQNHAIMDAVDQTSSVLTCTAPHWDIDQPVCQPVCQLSFTTLTSWHDVHVCVFADFILRTLIPNSNVIQEDHDFINDDKLSEHVIECQNMDWIPAPPTCHKLGILIIGGDMSTTMEMYSPMEKISTFMDLELGEDIEYNHKWYGRISTLLSDGRLLIAGGFLSSGFSSRQTQIIDLSTFQITDALMMNELRSMAAMAKLSEEPYVCGGDNGFFIMRSCEVLRNGSWVPIARMKAGRVGHAMAASREAIYVIGGHSIHMGSSYTLVLLNSVEKYDRQTNEWTEVAPMPEERTFLAAAEFNQIIYICGGTVAFEENGIFHTKSCLKYIVDENIWHEIDGLSSNRAEFHMVAFAGRIYALGGEGDEIGNKPGKAIMTIECLNIETEQWTNEGQLLAERILSTVVVVPLSNTETEQQTNQEQLEAGRGSSALVV